MSKLVKLDTHYWPLGGYGHWCPGCDSGHEINVDRPNSQNAKWSFDDNVDSPTFSPSINIRWGKYAGQQHTEHGGVCHYSIQGGMIKFSPDSTHQLSGKTIELPDIPDGKYITCERL